MPSKFYSTRPIFIHKFPLSYWSVDQQNYIKKMAAMAATVTMEVTWKDVLSSIDNLLMETEIQDSNSDLGLHEAALVLNRLEMAVSVLRAIVVMELDLDRNVGQVLGQLCSLLTDIYQYWGAKVSQMR